MRLSHVGASSGRIPNDSMHSLLRWELGLLELVPALVWPEREKVRSGRVYERRYDLCYRSTVGSRKAGDGRLGGQRAAITSKPRPSSSPGTSSKVCSKESTSSATAWSMTFVSPMARSPSTVFCRCGHSVLQMHRCRSCTVTVVLTRGPT